MWWQHLSGWLAALWRGLCHIGEAMVDTRPGSGPAWDQNWDDEQFSIPGDEFWGQDI